MTSNEFLINRANKLGLSQIDIAKGIAKRQSGEASLYKGIVNKWFKSSQTPGKSYLLDLSEILNVSVESILRGEDISYDCSNRPTAYSATKTGNEYIINRLFNNSEAHINAFTIDEYGRPFIDYALEFNNFHAFQIAYDLGYLPLKSWGCNQEITSAFYSELDIAKFIIHFDCISMFQKLFGRLIPFENSLSNTRIGYLCKGLPESICLDILDSNLIFKNYIEPFPFTESEWNLAHINYGVEVISEEDNNLVHRLPSLPIGFNKLLKTAILTNREDKTRIMLKIALQQIDDILKILGDRISDFQLNNDFSISFKNSYRGIFGFMPYIDSIDAISNEDLKEKALEINRLTNII